MIVAGGCMNYDQLGGVGAVHRSAPSAGGVNGVFILASVCAAASYLVLNTAQKQARIRRGGCVVRQSHIVRYRENQHNANARKRAADAAWAINNDKTWRMAPSGCAPRCASAARNLHGRFRAERRVACVAAKRAVSRHRAGASGDGAKNIARLLHHGVSARKTADEKRRLLAVR